jgi:hypothetical protein
MNEYEIRSPVTDVPLGYVTAPSAEAALQEVRRTWRPDMSDHVVEPHPAYEAVLTIHGRVTVYAKQIVGR